MWDQFTFDFADLYKHWHDYWVEALEKNEFPVFYFRFEDLITDPYPVSMDLFAFILGVESIEGTYIDHRIKQKLAKGAESS